MLPRMRVSRRRVLASLGTAPVVSLLTSSADAGSQARSGEAAPLQVPRTEAVLALTLDVDLSTPADATVGSAVIRGGAAAGEFGGAVVPGCLTWTRDPVRGVLQLESRFELQVDEGQRIHVVDRATVIAPLGHWEAPITTTPELTMVGSSADLREAVYVGRMDASQIQSGRLRLIVHRVL